MLETGDGTERPFGGLGVMFFGDFSQLKPVSGTTLASHPEVAVGSIATHGSNGVGSLPEGDGGSKIGLAASRNRSIAKTSVQAASSLRWIDRPIGF